MDLGITGRTAFVAASSQGLGLACATSLAREGVIITLNGRDESRLAAAADAIRLQVRTAVVGWVVADLTTRTGIDAILRVAPEVDIFINNNAGPPPGQLESWDEDALLDSFSASMVPGVQLMRAWIPGMRDRSFGRIVNITSAMVKAPKYDMGLSASARAALTAICKAISTEVASDNVTINNVLPERIDTPRLDYMARRRMAAEGIDKNEALRRIASTIAAKRLGRPEELGDTCAFLCSAQAGYISGQNVQIDGGTYEGLI